MPVTLELVEDESALLLTVTWPWTINDLIAVYPQATELLDRSTKVLSIINNISGMGNVPGNPMGAIRNSPFLKHRNAGIQIVVGTGAMATTFGNIAFKLAHLDERAKFVSTLDEAWQYIHEQKKVK